MVSHRLLRPANMRGGLPRMSVGKSRLHGSKGRSSGLRRLRPRLMCLTGELLNLDDDELGGFERGEPDNNVHNAKIDVVLGRGVLIALDEVGLARRCPLKIALAE